eukprot:GFYU01028021.1.p1 GENE.GFYU01028021.1~~GFYU01028021.1.p1  ORF type:complete len:492 (+),score=150.87 GFYU01028021.1:37-1512(+)
MSDGDLFGGYDLLKALNVKVSEPSTPAAPRGARSSTSASKVLTPKFSAPRPGSDMRLRSDSRGGHSDPVLRRTRYSKGTGEDNELTPKVGQSTPAARAAAAAAAAGTPVRQDVGSPGNEDFNVARRLNLRGGSATPASAVRSNTSHVTTPGTPVVIDDIQPSEEVDPDLVCDICINSSIIADKAARLKAERDDDLARARQMNARVEEDIKRQNEEADKRRLERIASMQHHAEEHAKMKAQQAADDASANEAVRARREAEQEAFQRAVEADAKKRDEYRTALQQQIDERKARDKKEAEDARSPMPGTSAGVDAATLSARKMEYRNQLEKQIQEKARQRLEDQKKERDAQMQSSAEKDAASERYAEYMRKQQEMREALVREWKDADARKSAEKERRRAERRAAADSAAKHAQEENEASLKQLDTVRKRRAEFAAALREQIDEKHAACKHERAEMFASPSSENSALRRHLLRCKQCARPLPPSRFSKMPKSPWK